MEATRKIIIYLLKVRVRKRKTILPLCRRKIRKATNIRSYKLLDAALAYAYGQKLLNRIDADTKTESVEVTPLGIEYVEKPIPYMEKKDKKNA
jgi:hypothetical protein